MPPVSLSLNHGVDLAGDRRRGNDGRCRSCPLAINLRDQVNGAYETLIRIQMTPDPGFPGSVALTGLTITTLTQVNAKALPRLNIGRNQVYVGEGDQSDSMVLWPDLRGTLWMKDAYDSSNIAAQAVNVPRKYSAVVYPSTLNQDAYLTYKMDAPTDITRLVYGARLYNSRAGSYIDFLHSFDNGATWVPSYRLSDTSKPFDVIHYETVTNVPPGVRTVLFKYLIHNTSTAGASSASGLYAVRMEADYATDPRRRSANRRDLPLEGSPDRSIARRSQLPSARHGLSHDGDDRRRRQRSPGHGIAEGQRRGSFRSDAGRLQRRLRRGRRAVRADETDGRHQRRSEQTLHRLACAVRFPEFGTRRQHHDSHRRHRRRTGHWEQLLLVGTVLVVRFRTLDLQIDLGSTASVSAFRAHIFGYPFWDALKGRVQDTVEILTSIDGITFTSQGLLPTSLWKKDIPVNYMLQDDETATGWNFEQRLASPAQARYVRYHITPQRNLCLSELQVFDRIVYQPFDLRIALPADSPAPVNTPPSVAMMGPANNAQFQQPVSITMTAAAHDPDGTVARVEFFADAASIGTVTAPPYQLTWANASAGQHALTAVATDDGGASAVSAPITVTVSPATIPPGGGIDEIVLYAAVSAQVASGWEVTQDPTAAGGARLQNPDRGAAKVAAPLQSPILTFDLMFTADPNKAYRLWLRGKAQNDSYNNDSVFVQFDNSVDASGNQIWRTNSTTAGTVILEDCNGCGVRGWGWADTGYGPSVLGPLVYFAHGGTQRIRIQSREDGLGIDQIVLSAVKYLRSAPGATTDDATILPATQPTAGSPPSINEVVLYPGVDALVGGGWTFITDATAAAGLRLQNPDAGQPKLSTPLASPAAYFDVTFNADAGQPYHLWLRGVAQENDYYNDSVFVQFDHSIDASGNPVWRINTASATSVILEDCSNCGVKGWGWSDNGYGLNVLGPVVHFASSGPQRLRIQVREDGLGIDQIVLSAIVYSSLSPGATKNDTIIVPR